MKNTTHKREKCGSEKSIKPLAWKKRGIMYSFFELILYYGSNNVAELFCKVNGKSTNT